MVSQSEAPINARLHSGLSARKFVVRSIFRSSEWSHLEQLNSPELSFHLSTTLLSLLVMTVRLSCCTVLLFFHDVASILVELIRAHSAAECFVKSLVNKSIFSHLLCQWLWQLLCLIFLGTSNENWASVRRLCPDALFISRHMDAMNSCVVCCVQRPRKVLLPFRELQFSPIF